MKVQSLPQRVNHFGTDFAQRTYNSSRPDSWWKMFGVDTPNLQKMTIRLLSQTTSSPGCECNWSVFDRIHTKKRNRLEHKRLCNVLYVQYNLRLKNRLEYRKRSYDPVDYESIDRTEFWIVEDEPKGELDIEELRI